MPNMTKIIIDGTILSVLASLYLIAVLRFNPRLFLQDYPADIQDQVPPKTEAEKRQSLIVGAPFLLLLATVPFVSTLTLRQSGEAVSFLQLFLNAFGVLLVFNLVDLVLLDWLVFCAITPRFVVIPGTEGMAGYKDYVYHLRASLVGVVLCIVAGLVIAGITWFL